MMPTEIVDLEVQEVSLVDEPANQHARVVLFKRNAPVSAVLEDLQRRVDALSSANVTMETSEMPTLSETIMKSLEPSPSDTDKERAEKELVRKQLETGAVTAEAIAANLILEAHARQIQKRDGCSFETAYTKAIVADPQTAALAIG